MTKLYAFEKLAKFLDEIGAPKVDGKSGYKVVRTDFGKAYEEGNIEFREDGIYLAHEGESYKGYVYEPSYLVSKYSFPRFHITKCEVLQKFLDRGIFSKFYEWAYQEHQDVIDRETGQLYSNVKLPLCSRCKNEVFSTVIDSNEFYDSLDISEIMKSSTEVDINGYDKNFQKISRDYRKSKNFACEICNIELKGMDSLYLHTHHIDHDKSNNDQSNLQCLCELCHSQVDDLHRKNFSEQRMKNKMKSFIDKYENALRQVGNPYVDEYNHV